MLYGYSIGVIQLNRSMYLVIPAESTFTDILQYIIRDDILPKEN